MTTARTTKGEVIFSAPIHDSPTHDRAIVEHGNGVWSIGRVSRADPSKLTTECQFSIDELQEIAAYGLTGSPLITQAANRQAGKALAGGVMLLLIALGLTPQPEPAK